MWYAAWAIEALEAANLKQEAAKKLKSLNAALWQQPIRQPGDGAAGSARASAAETKRRNYNPIG